MNEGLTISSPIFLIVAVLSFVALIAGLVVARIRKDERKLMPKNQKLLFYALLFSGISISLFGGFFMFDGDILGEGTGGIARIMGFVGLALIIGASTVAGTSSKESNHR